MLCWEDAQNLVGGIDFKLEWVKRIFFREVAVDDSLDTQI